MQASKKTDSIPSIPRNQAIVLGCVFALLSAVAFTTCLQMFLLASSKQSIGQTHESILALQQIRRLSDRLDAPQGDRPGYRDDDYAGKRISPSFTEQIAVLQAAARHRPARLDELRNLEALFERCLALSSHEPSQATDSEALPRLLEKVDRLVDYMLGQESTALRLKLESSQILERNATIACFTLAILLLLLMVLSGYLVRGYWLERRKSEGLALASAGLEARLSRQIMEKAPLGILRLSKELLIEETNTVFLENMSRPKEDIVGKSLHDLLPRISKRVEDRVIKGKKTLDLSKVMLSLGHSRKGSKVYWSISSWPILEQNEEVIGAILIVMEIPERVRLMEERNDLFATIAHDLKVPLIGADRMLGLLLDGEAGELQIRQLQMLSMLKYSNENLLRLVQTLGDIHRYEEENHKLFFEKLKVFMLVEDCLSEYVHLAKEREVELKNEIDKDLVVSVDKMAVSRVLTNLIDNAIKFTPAGGSIRLAADTLNDSITIDITNTGSVIRPEVREKLFERFWQGIEGRSKPSGSGLGLYLCRTIIEAHNGTISCQSDEKTGTTFSIRLPARQKTIVA